MIEALVFIAATALPSNDRAAASEWAVSQPIHGLHGKYRDSNVREVWEGVPHSVRSVWKCIRMHESISYVGENPVSSASGAGQWINSTWDGLKKWVKVDGKFVASWYDEAKDAPAWVQDAAFLHVYKRGGLRMWRGTGCEGTW